MRVNSLGAAAPGRPDSGATGRGGGSFDGAPGEPPGNPGEGGAFGTDPGVSRRLNNSVKSPPADAGGFAIGAIGGADRDGRLGSTGGITESKRAAPGDNDGRAGDCFGGWIGGEIGGGGVESLPNTPVKLSAPGGTADAGGFAGALGGGAAGARGANDGGGANDGWRAAGGGSVEGDGGGEVGAAFPGTTVGVKVAAGGADGGDGNEAAGRDAGGGNGGGGAAGGVVAGGVVGRATGSADFTVGGIPWKTRVNSPGGGGAGRGVGGGVGGADCAGVAGGTVATGAAGWAGVWPSPANTFVNESPANGAGPAGGVEGSVAGAFGGIDAGAPERAGVACLAGVAGADSGGVAGRGTAWMICVAASWMSSFPACWPSQAGRSVNDVRKCVTTTCVPSTSTISKTFAVAAGSSDRACLSSVDRSAAVPTSREWTMTIRPSAVSWAIWLRAPFSVSVLRMRYFAVNSALVIT